jgi:hypothetical protein
MQCRTSMAFSDGRIVRIFALGCSNENLHIEP